MVNLAFKVIFLMFTGIVSVTQNFARKSRFVRLLVVKVYKQAQQLAQSKCPKNGSYSRLTELHTL